MRLLGQEICWSATDLTMASTCEYAVLRELDERLGRGEPRPRREDPLLAQIAAIGDRHEAEIRERFEADPELAAGFVALERPRAGASAENLYGMHAKTVDALSGDARVVFQAGFFDGEFIGFADFLISSEYGWVVSDAKLARQARPQALLQLGAYAEQIARAGLPLASRASLLLGDGEVDDFPLCDIMPVFRERRSRLRHLITEHMGSDAPVTWGDERYVACGQCADCEQAVEKHRDLLLVAGMRMSQRKKLRASGAITVDDLVVMAAGPADMSKTTFEKLAAQARLQLKQMKAEAGPGNAEKVFYELVGDGKALRMLPAPSPGDIFFDYEGDPLYRESDPKIWGLEYLWGVVEAPLQDLGPKFTRWWAHNRTEEKQAFVEFMDYVAQRRAEYPDMHIYHYAPYETTALKRLAGRYSTHQGELDDLLRSVVFVDLYAVVRSAIRVSQPSYSIKKVEPLYMSGEDRGGMDVAAGDVSIAEYHAFQVLRSEGKETEAAAKLGALEDYNRYDCVSTLRLRDWLLDVADQNGLASVLERTAVHRGGEQDEEQDHTAAQLRAKAGPDRPDRSANEQAYAMLASALGYHRRESLPFWWGHFTRLGTPDIAGWSPDRDVFRVTSHEVLDDWHVPEGKQVLRRRLLLKGEWGPGSTPGSTATVVYRKPCPDGAELPEKAEYGCFHDIKVEVSAEDEHQVVLVEALKKDGKPHSETPVALTPPKPPRDGGLRSAIREVADMAARASTLPPQPAIDVLRRTPPRLVGLDRLPHTDGTIDDIAQALLHLESSYVPVQGPPGTGKTYTGSRVIKKLVEEQGWRIGVVAQSHAVVENMLAAIARAGLSQSLIGKKDSRSATPTWTCLDGKRGTRPADFLTTHADTGCVLGGTAWTFTSEGQVARDSLDLLVIDEAGQFALASTIAVSVSARRLLLLGDPQQLPQVSQGTHDEPVDESALGWVMGEADTLPRGLGYFLATTYRMHPALTEKVSVLSYDGELHSAPCTEERLLEGVAPGLETVIVENAYGNSVASEEEAVAVVDQVQRLIGRPWHDPEGFSGTRPLCQEDFRVVAPYNAQVQLIRKRLREAGYPDVRVGTVDKFQGQEAPVAIVSMTASSQEDVPRGMGFLLNRNRVNVAISRAQWLAVLVRSRELTSYMPSTPQGLLELGGFIGLSE